MEKISLKEGRKLYGGIIESSGDIEEIVSVLPSCICRGRCVCRVTVEPHKLEIEEIRNYVSQINYEQKYKKAKAA